MAKTITQRFKSLEGAEAFQDELYEKYDSVQLIQAPRFDPRGAGCYVWKVEDHK
jgi:hypothetical protein